eukprot:6717865-Prymnesium_polylepis.3
MDLQTLPTSSAAVDTETTAQGAATVAVSAFGKMLDMMSSRMDRHMSWLAETVEWARSANGWPAASEKGLGMTHAICSVAEWPTHAHAH